MDETQHLRALAKEAEKHKAISQAAVLFVTHHKAFKNLVMNSTPDDSLLQAAKISVNTYLTELVKVVEASHGA